jgi:transposase
MTSLLSCTDPTISAADLATLYKGLLDVERCWRDLKQVVDIRPIYHSKDQRIRAHVLLCYLALMLVRVAENATGMTWNRIRLEMQRMHLGDFTGPAGHLQQRTETTQMQREIFHALKIKEPPVILHHTT